MKYVKLIDSVGNNGAHEVHEMKKKTLGFWHMKSMHKVVDIKRTMLVHKGGLWREIWRTIDWKKWALKMWKECERVSEGVSE